MIDIDQCRQVPLYKLS